MKLLHKSVYIVSILIFLSVTSVNAESGLSISSNITGEVLLPGDEGYLIVKVKNTGADEIPNVYLILENVDPPLVIEDLGEPRYFDILKGNGEIESTYRISVPENTPIGTYLAQFKTSELTLENEEKVIIYNALIEVTGSSELVISSLTPSSLSPGQRAELSVTLENEGTSKLKNIELSWNTPNDVLLPLEKDSKIIISEMLPNSAIDISIPVIAKSNIDSYIYPMNFTGSYYVNGNKETTESVVGMIIGGTTDFGVSAQSSTTGSIAVTVANIGMTPAYSVSVKIGPSEAFIGNIDSGDYSIANIVMPTRSNTTNKQPTEEIKDRMMQEGFEARSQGQSGFQMNQNSLEVQVEYTDTLGERHSVVKEASLSQTSQSSKKMPSNASPVGGQTSNNTLYAGIGILLIVITVSIYKRRRDSGK